MQEEAVEQQDGVGFGLLLHGVHRTIGSEIESTAPEPARAAATERVEHEAAESGVVVGIEEEPFGGVPAAAMAHLGGVHEVVRADPDDLAARRRKLLAELVSECRLARAVDAVDCDPRDRAWVEGQHLACNSLQERASLVGLCGSIT